MKPWPLAVSPYSFWDRLKVAAWLLANDRYTMGEQVAAFEEEFSAYTGMHAVACSSGSAANTLLFEVWKKKNPTRGNSTVICPAVTWGSSIAAPLMAGLNIRFCDINLTDFCFDYNVLEQMLIDLNREAKERRHPSDRQNDSGVIIWATALIGFVPNMRRLHVLAKKYGAELFLDSCENSLSKIPGPLGVRHILSSCGMTTTSCYFAHHVVAIEFGFLFLKNSEDTYTARLIRNHGLSRSLPKDSIMRQMYEQSSPDIDPEFLFIHAGTNLRPTEINAVFGRIDFDRREARAKQRVDLYLRYRDNLDESKFYVPPFNNGHVPFCLPIFVKDRHRLEPIKKRLRENGIDTRPIVGGCLPMHPAFRDYARSGSLVKNYPNAMWVHSHGFYIGVHHGLRARDIDRLNKLLRQ